MSQQDVVAMLKDAISTATVVAAPFLLISVTIGLATSIIQAATQVNEQSVAFVLKIVSIGSLLAISAPWILTNLSDFFDRLMQYIQLSV